MATTEEYTQSDEQVTAISRLPPNLAIMRMEMDAIQSLAAARPRDMAKIKTELSDTLKAFPELAAEAIYNKPVGKVSLIDCNCGYQYEATSSRRDDMLCPSCGEVKPKSQRQVQKYARGLSIKAAEALAECYGFNSVKADVEPLDGDSVKVVGVFVDYQRGTRREFTSLVSRWYKAKGGGMVKHADDRFADLVVKSAQSKVVREAIVRSVNAGLKSWFFDQCDKIQDNLLDDPAVAKIVGQFATKNVSLEMIEQLLGRPKSAGWTQEDRKTLLGVWNALKNGDATVQELFRPDDDQPASGNASASGSVTADGISGATATGKDKDSVPFPAADAGPKKEPAKKKAKPEEQKPESQEQKPLPGVAGLVAEFLREISLVRQSDDAEMVAGNIDKALAAGDLIADEAAELRDALEAHVQGLQSE